MSRRIVLAGLFLIISLPAVAQGPETNPPQNVAIVEAMFRFINQRTFDEVDMVVAENVVRHSGARAEIKIKNRKEFMDLIHQDLAAVPDAQYEINFIFGGEDMVAMHATYRGTQVGQFGEMEASGNRVELPFMGIYRIEAGKIAEMWIEWDSLTALEQMEPHFGK